MRKAIIACKSLESMYFTELRSVSEKKLIAWAWIEKPPQLIMAVTRGRVRKSSEVQRALQPFVISRIPHRTPLASLKPSLFGIRLRRLIIPLMESAFEITENKMIKPPMASMPSIEVKTA